MKQRVFVTGMGIINSVANSITDFQNSLREGRQGIGFLQNKSGTASVNVGAEIRDYSFELTLQKLAALPGVPSDMMVKAKKCAQRSPFAIQVAVSVEPMFRLNFFKRQS
jgi:malonyl-ACP decarboxylase